MAEKNSKSQAQKASTAKNKKPSGKSTGAGKRSGNKAASSQQSQSRVPVRVITSLICLVLFVLFLVAFLNPEGALVKLFLIGVQALIGKVGFYVAIPALLYLLIIQAFSGKRPILARSVCLICFVLICGCISQLSLACSDLPTGWKLLQYLLQGGSEGTTAGLICGGITLVLYWLTGKVISYIILITAAVLTLLGSFQITIPSIVRAIENRPRADWEDEEPEEVQEPAAVVVNHLANKRIEYVENKRRVQAEPVNIDVPLEDAPAKPAAPRATKRKSRASELMRQIDGDVNTPVAAAADAVVENADADLILGGKSIPADAPAVHAFTLEDIPTEMQPFEKDSPIVPEAETPPEAVPAAPEPKPQKAAEPKPDKVTASQVSESQAQVAEEIARAQSAPKPIYQTPPLDLLNPPKRGTQDATMEMRENTRRLNETLMSFKIEAHIINVTRGPSVTRYEVELDKGVRLNKLTGCADDIALSLGASGVRIAAVPGKISIVGIEVPNRTVTTVSLREVIDSPEFSRAKSKSSFAVGKDIGGSCIVGDIAKLPHMLIAGTTGSGKSVCMNSIIISLLYKAGPEDVKLIMVDPKMVELGIYNDIPHLLIPVVTDPKKAAGSLQWAVSEMMRRYKAMSDAGVRDLESYNSIVEAEQEGEKIPQVVVIIDELADLMLAAAKEVEESICRIAQMGRAAGIHLIIATQRPSADVITGLMKANIPSRIAFAVASALESRIILDTQGAEKLVGKGDMLYAPIGAGKPIRVQGCFVSDAEVEAVTDFVKKNHRTEYDDSVMKDIDRNAAQTGTGKGASADLQANAQEMGGDEMLPAAVDVILETGQASVSMLQRRLKLGYARAARIVDEMEEQGIVGPFQGSKPRAILITKEQWQARKAGQPVQMEFSDMEEGVPDEID